MIDTEKLTNKYLGCPNCKAKRIKCTEELPSCHNCIKKNYRCGYIDFPEEKLELLRKKNEKKKEEHNYMKGLPGGSFDPSTPQGQSLLQNSSRSSLPNSAVSEASLPTSLSPNFQHPRSRQQQQSPLNQTYQTTDRPHQHKNFNADDVILKDEFYNNKESLRMSLFKDTIFRLSKGESEFTAPTTAEDSTLKFFPTDYNPEHTHVNLGDDLKNNSRENFPITSDQNEILYLDDIGTNEVLFNQRISKDYDTAIGFEWDNTQGKPQGSNNSQLEASNENNNANRMNFNPLPNAIISRTSFPKLEQAKRLRNTYLERYLNDSNRDVKSLINLEFKTIFSPVWTNANADSFWASVYNQSVVLEVYFSFFMDRSLNVLLKTCNVTLNGEIFSNLSQSPLYSSVSASDTSLSSRTSSDDGFFFTKNDLDILTQKSYRYYGALIRDLRESLTNIHIEYPLKISLFAAWSIFFHMHATVETLCLMYSGTSSLLVKVFNDSLSLHDITPTIRVTLEVLNGHALAALIPDYDFEIILEIYRDFKEFKNFFMNAQDTYVRRYAENNTEDGRKKRLTSNLEKHDCLELEQFLEHVVKVILPKLNYINRYYKASNNVKDPNSNNIYFTSVRLIFDLLVSWFKNYPSEALSMGSSACPVKKTFYLFYSVIGRALVNVISPVRSVLLVDPCHLFCPRVDFDPYIYKVEKININTEEYNYLRSLSEKMLRMVTFFDYRMLFYSYFLSTRTTLNAEYVKPLNVPPPPDSENYNDIVQLLPKKMDVNEITIGSFSNITLDANHFPIFDIFHSDNEYRSILRQEHQKQHLRQQQLSNEFNYKTGLFAHDFNPRSLFNALERSQKSYWNLNQPTLEEIRIRVQNFDFGRQAVSETVRNN